MKRQKRTPVLLTVFRKTPMSKVRKLIQNPVRLTEDEADYQLSMAAIREGGKSVSAESILKKYGRRVDRIERTEQRILITHIGKRDAGTYKGFNPV